MQAFQPGDDRLLNLWSSLQGDHDDYTNGVHLGMPRLPRLPRPPRLRMPRCPQVWALNCMIGSVMWTGVMKGTQAVIHLVR